MARIHITVYKHHLSDHRYREVGTRDECRAILERIIGFYNTERPHMSINMQTPEQAHVQYGEQHRCWKNSYAMG